MQQDIKLYEKRVVKDKEFPLVVEYRRYRPNGGFAPHWHEDIEMHYILSGEMSGMHDQEPYKVKAGDLLIANSNVLHSGHRDSEEPYKAVLVLMNLEGMSKRLSDRNIMFQQIISDDPFVSDIMHKLDYELEKGEEEYQLTCKGLVLQLVAHLVRHYIKEELSEKENIRRVRKLERFTPVIRYIEKHYTEDISNRELADMIHLGEDRFNHLFKDCMGISPLQYINGIRMEKAMHFLKMGQYSATEVASLVGISDYNHFGRLFRRTYGCTPTQVFKDEKLSENKIVKK